MATTKTIQPTGATITIPDFTDKPDMRLITTDVSSITDAANALSDQIANFPQFLNDDINGNTTKTYTLSNNARMVYFSFGNAEARCAEYLVYTHSSGAVTLKEVIGGTNITVSSSSNNSVTISNSGSVAARGYFLIFAGTITPPA